jgi:hypothetical protein
MEELQKQLDEVLEKIKESGFKVDENFKLYNPEKLIYAVEEYWKREGAYESQGKIKECHFMCEISDKSFTLINEGLKSNAKDFIEKVYDGKIDIKGFNPGNYDITYCDEGEEFVEDMQVRFNKDGSIVLDFGDDYRESSGGYVIIKQVSLSELNEFEEVDIDTFD